MKSGGSLGDFHASPLWGRAFQRRALDEFGAVGNRFAFLNVEIGHSSAPEVEAKVLEDVGGYGEQLGRIGDARRVLLDHFEPEKPLSRKEKKAIRALQAMLDEIDIKRGAGRAPPKDESPA